MTDVQKKNLEDRRWVQGLLVLAEQRKWYGTLGIEFKAGKILLVHKDETIKPPTKKI